MSKTLNLTHEDIARAMHGSVKLAQNGTPEQKAGMFRPSAPANPVPSKREAVRAS